MKAIFPERTDPTGYVVWADRLYPVAEYLVGPFGEVVVVADEDATTLLHNGAESSFQLRPGVRVGNRFATLVEVRDDGTAAVVPGGWRHAGDTYAPDAVEVVPVTECASLFQVRYEVLPAPDYQPAPFLYLPPAYPVPDVSEAEGRYLDEITRALAEDAPEGWTRIDVEVWALGAWQLLTASATTTAGVVHWSPRPMVGQGFTRLRTATYGPSGAWYRADYVVERDGTPRVAYDRKTEPPWRPFYFRPHDEPDFGYARQELLRFPRALGDTPDWLVRAAAELLDLEVGAGTGRLDPWQPALSSDLTSARTFDAVVEGDTPVFHRQPVNADEKQLLLGFLRGGVVVLAGRGHAPDLMHPEREQRVPMTYLTDGRWVWSESVTHYLEHYDIAPDNNFLAHIRHVRYSGTTRLPTALLARATSLVTRQYQGGTAEDVEPGLAAEVEQAYGSAASVARFLGLAPSAYSIGSEVDGALCLVREGDYFVVFWSFRGERRFSGSFDNPGDAATYLIGFFYSYSEALREPVETGGPGDSL
ncbi:hypothetical protein GCM10022243_04650 [Saccharothrix violaceirubra]|uniref:Uncharacterized protein n=1 Tax=Saccharothrix violaceirubra TaxID=413306 RepID=A0A7W7SXQ0_9PSEU|nr:hypothetical protein [Saccharothrix violaceirubra]MBB4962874.1 hypothetical protein [Saccharothrix violaceirubra]